MNERSPDRDRDVLARGVAHSRTSTELLGRLAESRDDAAWSEVDRRFRPIILRTARRLGLRAADAEEVAQEALLCVIRDFRAGKYDRERGRLQSWILSITRFRIKDQLRRNGVDGPVRGESAFAEVAGTDPLAEVWREEAERAIVDDAMTRLIDSGLESKTIEAFRLCSLEERLPEDVARELGMTAQSVYNAKHRCLRRLRELLVDVRRCYEFDD